MALVPHRITALAKSDAEGTAGQNIVAGASVSMFDEIGNAILLYDDENGTNGSTAKTTDSSGQVVVWVTPGEYRESVNGSTLRRVTVGGKSATEVGTFADLQLYRPTKEGQAFICQERGNAKYIVQPVGYSSKAGDVTFSNGRVGSMITDKSVTIRNFGGTGYGLSDDTSAMVEALSRTDVIVDGEGLTYLVTGDVSIRSHGLKNANVIFEGGVGSSFLRAVNSYGSEITLGSDANYGDITLSLSSTSGISSGDFIFLSSDGQWSDDGSEVVSQGESIEVLSVDSGTILTLSSPVDSTYLVSDNAKVQKISTEQRDIKIDNVHATGQGDGFEQYGGVFARIIGLNITRSTFEKFDKAGIYVEGAVNFSISNGCTFKDSLQSGFGYNIMLLNANRNGTITGNHFSNGRTAITQGGTSGVGRDIVIDGNTAIGHYTAAFNTKGAASNLIISNNICIGNGESATGLGDGIRFRGRDCTITGNRLRGYGRYSIYTPVNGDKGMLGSCKVESNVIEDAIDIPIYIDVKHVGLSSVTVSNNIMRMRDVPTRSNGAINVRVDDVDVEQLTILGNQVSNSSFAGIDVRTSGSGTIGRSIQRDNVVELNSTAIAGGRREFLQSGLSNYILSESGSGDPNGQVHGGVGSTYQRADGSSGSSFYVKESGNGNTGWVAK